MFGMLNPRVTRNSISLMIFESVGAVWAVDPWVTRASTSLMIYESLGAVCAVESLCHTCQQVVDDCLVPRACLG
jgi:hypothetical protein